MFWHLFECTVPHYLLACSVHTYSTALLLQCCCRAACCCWNYSISTIRSQYSTYLWSYASHCIVNTTVMQLVHKSFLKKAMSYQMKGLCRPKCCQSAFIFETETGKVKVKRNRPTYIFMPVIDKDIDL